MMLRRIARPMLAAWFVTEGVAGFRGAPHHLEPTRTGVDALVERFEITRPTEEQIRTIVKVHGAATAGAGLALALGKAPRVAALVLAALTLPAAVVNLVASRTGAATPAAKAERREHAIRALSFAGAALIAAADREGRPGLACKVSHARKLAAASAGASVLGAKHSGEKASKAVKGVKGVTVAEAKAARKAAEKGAGAVTAVLGAKAAKAAKAASDTTSKPSRADARAAKAAARADARAAAVAEKQGAKAAKAATKADAKAVKLAEKDAAQAAKAAKVATKADAKAAKLAEKDAARAAKAATAAEAEAVKAAKTTRRADARAAKRLRRSATESVVTPG